MPRPSKIDRLPGEVREEIATLRERGHTVDEILAHLRAMPLGDGLPSRSGLGRHIQSLDALAERIQRGRAVAEALVRRLGDAPESRQARLNIELLHSVTFDLLTAAEADEEAQLGPKEVALLARTMQQLTSAAKLDADATLKIREEAEKAATAAAAKIAETVGREKGLSRETVEAIKSQILGVRA